MTITVGDFNAHDQQIWDEELHDFVPDRVFDAHIHMFNREHLREKGKATSTWSDAGLATLQSWAQKLYPGRETHFLVLGTPTLDLDVAAHNQWCIDQVHQDPQSRMNRLVTPACSVKEIERDIKTMGFVGLKPYRLYSVTGDIAQCRIHEFLTHEQLELANELGLWVTMHLSRFHGCADEHNLNDLHEFTTRRYPRVKWILAHCARSFTYWPIRQAVDRLRDMPNIWYDLSAVTDVRPMITLFKKEKTNRILYGSDGVDATYFRGQYAAMGRAWQYVDMGRFDLKFPHCDGRPILAIYEQLLSMKHAAEIAELSKDDIQDIFWRNAAGLFDIQFRGDAAKPSIATNITQRTYERAKQILPGGTQLLSKRPEMYAPNRWPAYFKEASGCQVTDLDGRQYTDLTTSGIGSCLLGYADPDVTAAVRRKVARGSMSTLNSPEEVELAELLLQLHPWAEQVRYARSGGESMSIAVRIARAASKRDRVAFCGYHGWSDWYLAANLSLEGASDRLGGHLLPGLDPSGVPRGLAGTALPFTYNKLNELEELFARNPGEIGAVVMEPTRTNDPQPGFLEGVRKLCDQHGAVLVFDEISSGWRMHVGGVHIKFGVSPDIAVFAKAISNGHPMAAIIGRRKYMESAQTSFISSTYWTEGVGPTAALATIRKLQTVDIAAHTDRIGGLMRDGWNSISQRTGVPVKVSGRTALLHLAFDHEQAAALGTLFTVKMLGHGFLTGGGFYPSLAHHEHHIAQYLAAAEPVFEELATIIKQGNIPDQLASLGSSTRHSGFARLT